MTDRVKVPETFVTETLPALNRLQLPAHLETYDEKIRFLIQFYREAKAKGESHADSN